jgi:hypothetical protein
MVGSDATRVPDHEAGRIQPSRFITKFLLGELRRYFGPSRYHVTHEWSGTVSYTPDEYPIVGVMDGHRQYIIGGMAGSGTGVSFNAARCVVLDTQFRLFEEDDDQAIERVDLVLGEIILGDDNVLFADARTAPVRQGHVRPGGVRAVHNQLRSGVAGGGVSDHFVSDFASVAQPIVGSATLPTKCDKWLRENSCRFFINYHGPESR